MIWIFTFFYRIICDFTTIAEKSGVFTTTLVEAEIYKNHHNPYSVELIESQEYGLETNIFKNYYKLQYTTRNCNYVLVPMR